MIRHIGTLLLVSIFLFAGVSKLRDPKGVADFIKAGGLPVIVQRASLMAKTTIQLTEEHFILIVGLVSVAEIVFSMCILTGMLRRLCCMLLALMLVAITVCQHMDLKNPMATTQENIMHVIKNASIVGGLLILASIGSPAAAKHPPVAAMAGPKTSQSPVGEKKRQ